MKNKKPKSGLFIFKSDSGQWYWHLKSTNGKLTAGNGGFNTKAGAVKSIKSTMKYFKGVKTLKITYL